QGGLEEGAAGVDLPRCVADEVGVVEGVLVAHRDVGGLSALGLGLHADGRILETKVGEVGVFQDHPRSLGLGEIAQEPIHRGRIGERADGGNHPPAAVALFQDGGLALAADGQRRDLLDVEAEEFLLGFLCGELLLLLLEDAEIGVGAQSGREDERHRQRDEHPGLLRHGYLDLRTSQTERPTARTSIGMAAMEKKLRNFASAAVNVSRDAARTFGRTVIRSSCETSQLRELRKRSALPAALTKRLLTKSASPMATIRVFVSPSPFSSAASTPKEPRRSDSGVYCAAPLRQSVSPQAEGLVVATTSGRGSTSPRAVIGRTVGKMVWKANPLVMAWSAYCWTTGMASPPPKGLESGSTMIASSKRIPYSLKRSSRLGSSKVGSSATSSLPPLWR